jgi:hypothetical protein
MPSMKERQAGRRAPPARVQAGRRAPPARVQTMKERQDSIPTSLRSASFYTVVAVLVALPSVYYVVARWLDLSERSDWVKWLSVGATIPLAIFYVMITLNKLRDSRRG